VVNEKGQPLANVKLLAKQGWRNAITNEQGVFQFTGLTPQKYYIDADADNLPLVTPQFTATITKEGQIKKLPDVVMTPGALVIGTITNKETGEPVADATVGSSGNSYESEVLIRLITTHTDAEGKYQLRLPPGKNEIFASTTSKKYFRQFIPKSVDLKKDQTVTQNFTITSGETLSGVALDKDGKPMKDISVIVDTIKEKNDIETFLPRKTTTDTNGKWSISGIAPRKVQVRVAKPWATDKLITFTLPHPAKVLLQLIPQNNLPPIGRLMDTNGKPVADITVNLQYKMPHLTPFDIKSNTVLTSDKNGYLHFRMPLVAEFPNISEVKMKGYQWTTGGDWDDKSRRFENVILDPLTRKINGHVVDIQDKPVANARVLIVGLGKDETETKQDGSFVFTDLPDHQQLTVLTIGNLGVAKMILSDSQKTAAIQLKPLRQIFPSRAQSLDALETLYNSTEEAEQNLIIDDIARYDVARALKMIQGNQKVFPAARISQTLDLLTASNPPLALQWGAEHLGQVTEKDRIAILCQLAKVAAKQNTTLAQKYFSQAVALANTIPEPKEKKYKDKKSTDPKTLTFLQSRLQLAGAAAKAQPAQTRKWVNAILRFTKDNTDGSLDWPRSELVSELAVNDPQEAARVIANSDENTKIFEYQNAVQAAVRSKNSKLALYWLEQFQLFGASFDERSSTYSELQEAAISTISLIGPNDPEQALQLAKLIDNANAFVEAAKSQPRQIALKILREQYDSEFIFGGARLVGLIYDRDKTEGKVLFDEWVKTYWAQLNTDILTRRSASEIAYSLARYKPRESWLMLQTEWAQSQENPSSRIDCQASLALAMSGVDFQQAMNWARQMEAQDKVLSIKTQRRLLEIALSTPKQRRDLCMDCFDFSDSYKPGDAVSW